MGFIEALCISDKKGIVKKQIHEAEFVSNWGISGDAHAGDLTRQVSLLAGESIDLVKDKLPQLSKGAFAENVITRGIALNSVQIGDKIQIGQNVILEITQIGKECHSACAIKKITGDCIMPKEGIFCRVLHGGSVKNGDEIFLN